MTKGEQEQGGGEEEFCFVIGVDVGGTNTDACILRRRRRRKEKNNKEKSEAERVVVVCSKKATTTKDVTTGVVTAISSCLAEEKREMEEIDAVMIGTTHFLNAVIERRGLVRVGVFRICSAASRAIPPFELFPFDLRKKVEGFFLFLEGGFEYDGRTPIGELNEKAIRDECRRLRSDPKLKNITSFVVSGVFSPINTEQENQVAEIIKQEMGSSVEITLSSEVGSIGLLERENAAILNAALRPLARKTISSSFKNALSSLTTSNTGSCPLYLTQNDGTLISADLAAFFPIFTFASGPTNSMRGAAHLSGCTDAIVVDIGGTTTDIGVLKNGFPRQAFSEVSVGGVPTNFRMPDIVSFGLGGGSLVSTSSSSSSSGSDSGFGSGSYFHSSKKGSITVGPESVGYELKKKGLVFGGNVLTTTDIAVAAGFCPGLGDPALVRHLNSEFVEEALMTMKRMVQKGIEQIKTNNDVIPVLLVGGGSVLLGEQAGEESKQGEERPIKLPHFDCANAVGAAIAQVSAVRDSVITYSNKGERDVLIAQLIQEAKDKVIEANGDPSTVEVVEQEETDVSYVENKTQIKIKVVADLLFPSFPSPSSLSPLIAIPAVTAVEQEPKTPPFETKQEIENLTEEEEEEGLSTTETPANFKIKLSQDGREWILNEQDVECISIGAAILGGGGGGSPLLGKVIVQRQLRLGRTVRIIRPESFFTLGEGQRGGEAKSPLVVPVGFMGAPTAIVEKLQNGNEVTNSVKALEKQFGKIAALMPLEIGGFNAMEPLVIAAEMDLPVIDCDLMGRAFPELQMTTSFIYGLPCVPTALGDEKGNVAVLHGTKDAKSLENLLRTLVVQMGCSAGIALPPLTPEELDRVGVKYTISQSWRLGREVLLARTNNQDPVEAVLKAEGGTLVFKGKVVDVLRKTHGGFAAGIATIEGLEEEFLGDVLTLHFKNEHLIARRRRMNNLQKKNGDVVQEEEGTLVASIPDILAVLDSDTGYPITTETMRFGFRVSVICIMCSPLLRTGEALKWVSPCAMGYPQSSYKPIGNYIPPDSVIPLPSLEKKVDDK